jgi:hypothetical protein
MTMNIQGMTDRALDAARDAAIEPVIEAIRKFVLLDRECDARFSPNNPHITRERFMLLWLSQILEGVGIDAERAYQSLRDDGLDLQDDPCLATDCHRPRKEAS